MDSKFETSSDDLKVQDSELNRFVKVRDPLVEESLVYLCSALELMV